MGDIDEEHRGGAAAASLYEWGGNNEDGEYEFLTQRPDFEMPTGTSRPKVTTADEKGYSEGIILPSAGFLNVTVSENSVRIEYCKTLPKGGYTVKDTVTLQEKEV